MSPKSLRIDRTFVGVGRIARATGTTIPKVRREMSKMLSALHETGRLDVLRAVRDGQLSLLEVLDAYRRHAIDTLPLAGSLKPLKEAMETWIASADVSAKHAVSLGQSLRYFLADTPDARVSDLPEILERLRETLGAKHPRSFNLARNAASRFIRATLKRSHPLYAKVLDVELRKVSAGRKHTPLSAQQMRGFFPSPATDHDDAIAWGMATTGMHQSEYWGRWSVLVDRIHVEGTKRKGRVRDLPLVFLPPRPTLHRRTWEDRMRERFAGRITPRDLRRTYANWLESAGIPRTRRKLYLGHSAGDVTGLYELHEVEAFLVADAAKLCDFLRLPTVSHTLSMENPSKTQRGA